MPDRTFRMGCMGFLLVTLLFGCSSTPPAAPGADDERAVREQFVALQSAIEKRDADALWELLDAKSHADAEHAAKESQAAHTKASAEEKAKQEEALGLAGIEVEGLTGKGILRTKRFHGKFHELPDSSIEKVTIQGDHATVYYLEADGDHEKAILVRQDGQWKVWLTMPKVDK